MLDLIVLLAVIVVGMRVLREIQRYRLDTQRIELLLMERIVEEATPQ